MAHFFSSSPDTEYNGYYFASEVSSWSSFFPNFTACHHWDQSSLQPACHIYITSCLLARHNPSCVLPLVFIILLLFSCSVLSTLCDPMDCSVPSLPVPHHLPELAQTHVHWFGDAIQPSHPLTSPSPSAFNFPQHQGLSSELALCIRWPKCWSFSISPSSECSGLIYFKIDLFDLLAIQGDS